MSQAPLPTPAQRGACIVAPAQCGRSAEFGQSQAQTHVLADIGRVYVVRFTLLIAKLNAGPGWSLGWATALQHTASPTWAMTAPLFLVNNTHCAPVSRMRSVSLRWMTWVLQSAFRREGFNSIAASRSAFATTLVNSSKAKAYGNSDRHPVRVPWLWFQSPRMHSPGWSADSDRAGAVSRATPGHSSARQPHVGDDDVTRLPVEGLQGLLG